MDRETVVGSAARRLGSSLPRSWTFAHFGIAAGAVFLITILCSMWWSLHSERQSLGQARQERFIAVGDALVTGVEATLINNDVFSLRRLISRAARRDQLSQCRVMLPDGRVIADGDPSRITVADLPDQWEGKPLVMDVGKYESGLMNRTVWLEVPGRGYAGLEMAARVYPQRSSWRMQAGLGVISASALVAILLLHRLVRSGIQGISAIRQSLLDYESGQESLAALEVNPDWGPEAKAWNRMLEQGEKLRKGITRDKTRESLQGRRSANSDLDAACDVLPQGLILVGGDLRASYANGAAAVLLQATREELLASEISKFLPDQRIADAVIAATTMPSRRRAIVEVNQDEQVGGGVLRFIVRPVRREDHGVGMIIIEDITQQRLAEESRNAFVVQATHELRTPLTNIQLYVEMALEDGEKDPAVRANCLNVINQETRRLDRMVGEILSLSEIEAGALDLKTDDVRLDELFRELQGDYSAQADDKQIDLDFVLPPKLPVIQGDRTKIVLGMHNLLGNALKYTDSGGKVGVNVSIQEGCLTMEVSDSGIGIKPEDSKRIFEKFYRAKDPRVTDATGSGLGLAIAREVIRMHGGDITVQSKLDTGSTFTLTLPIREAG